MSPHRAPAGPVDWQAMAADLAHPTEAPRCKRCDGDERRDALVDTLADHIRAKLPRLGEEPPSPRGCVILLALDVLGAGVALGPCEISELGVTVR